MDSVALPSALPVIILPGATLFPHAMLPLYIFEPRYRQMLQEILEDHRMLGVAMKKAGTSGETPCPIAGLGLVRAAVTHADGSSHAVLQGVARARLFRPDASKPYPLYQYEALSAARSHGPKTEAFTEQLLDLVHRRLDQGLHLAHPIGASASKPQPAESDMEQSALHSLKQNIIYLTEMNEAEQLTDLISCTLLSDPDQRQRLLESVDLEVRMKRLIGFLTDEIQRHNEAGGYE